MDEYHLRYDEFIPTADRAFGSFMAELEMTANCRTRRSSFRPIMGKALRAACINMRAPIRPARSFTYP